MSRKSSSYRDSLLLALAEPAEAEALIMRARVAMGWIEAPPEPEVEEEPVEATEAFAEAEMAGEAQDS